MRCTQNGMRANEKNIAILVGDLRRTRLCCSGSERRRICTPKWGHSAFSFWFWVVGDHPSALISQSRQSKQSWHVEQSLHATAPPHAPDDRHTDTPRTMGGYRARSGIAPQTPRRTDGGEAESHTHRSSADTLHVSARSMWPALSPLLSPFQRRRAATRRAEPVSAGDLGAARDAGMRDGSVGSVPKADRLGCELRQPPFLYLDHVQAVGGRAGWPRAGGGEGVRR